MLAATATVCLALFVVSACGLQENHEQKVEQSIYQAAINITDWPLQEGIIMKPHDGDTEIQEHSTKKEKNRSKPITYLPDLFDAWRSRYTLVDGLGYYRVVKGLHLNWEAARDACRAEGAHLAVVNSRREAAALRRLYYDEGIKTDLVIRRAWVGAYRPLGQHHYVTVHGTQLKKAGFNAWNDERDDKNTEERCVLLNVDTETLLSSIPCKWPQHHICEHEL
ncbi:hemolymph lipopolysaccharide-binding protein-like [Bacillus rossius redtenbacheri]|uniref:hemolymph lipopolysaccharide-binding protein-like n=1 Tax=Bacillus rossius redtenbacheri TaxID=93214 RepID=UPI002FDE910D